MPFQTAVPGRFLAPAVAGDQASQNRSSSYDAGPGALVVDPTGLIVGRFAWVDTTGVYARNFGTGPVAGFVRRDMMGLNTVYLLEGSMGLLPGTEATLMTSGDFWVVNSGAAVTYTPGTILKAFANNATGPNAGLITFAAPGATVAGAVETKWFLSGLAQGGTGAAGELVKISSYALG